MRRAVHRPRLRRADRPFRELFAPLRSEIRAPRHAVVFDQARTRRPAFAEHDTIISVLGALASDGAERYADKDALTRALLVEHQSSSTHFWASALLVAYYPMLSRLRHRIYGNALPSEDIDQLVVTSFLSVLREYPLDTGLDRTAMRLRQRTEHLVFRVVRGEQEARELMFPEPIESLDEMEQTEWPKGRANGSARPFDSVDAADAVSLLVEHAGGLLDGEMFDLMTATLVCGRRIGAHLRANLPEIALDERGQIYQRIKRRHSRTLERIRPALAHLRCPRDEAEDLFGCRDRETEKVADR